MQATYLILYHTRKSHVTKRNKLQKYICQHSFLIKEASFHMFFEKGHKISTNTRSQWVQITQKNKTSQLLWERRSSYRICIYSSGINSPNFLAIDVIANCICDRFQQKDYIETHQTMENVTLKALENFGHELQQISSFLAVNW